MTTDIETGKQIPPCKNHMWLYMKTLKYKDGRECYLLYCPFCWQKTIHMPDFTEEKFMEMFFGKYDKWKKKTKKTNHKNT